MSNEYTHVAMIGLLSNLQLPSDAPLPRFTTQTAVVVFPGEHQEWRIQEAAKVLQKVDSPHFWIAGTAGNPFYLRETILEEMERAIGSVERYRYSPLLVCGAFANDTRDQARFVLELLKARPEVTHLVLTTAAYHLPRCVLTCIKQMMLQDKRAVIYTTPSGAETIRPGNQELEEEIAKIPRYQAQGDIATWDELERYLAWRVLEIVRLKPDLR
ncbi:MAG: ElyC/SanA/YdcF family protein [bacterium]|nr:ElyC/SanA/YdcF family protein [bacterium]